MPASAELETGVDDDFTRDGTVDLKGNPVLRSSRGRWKACSFIVVYEVFERMAYHGISTNLIIFLTKRLHQGTVTSANNVTNWSGTVWIMPILGAYIADAHLGRYRTFVIASAICLMGMGLLTLAVSVPGLKPPRCYEVNKENCKQASKLQLAVFFGALYTLALGTGGTKPNISTMGADQFDEFHPREKAQKLSFFNWWMFSIFFGTLFATTILVYIQDNVGWSLGYGLPTIGLAISILIFVCGTPFYRHKLPNGSPFTKMANVIVAAAWNWKLHLPNDPKELHELDFEHYTNQDGAFRIDSTSSLRIFVKIMQRLTKNPRGITLLQRMGIGMILHIVIMTIASRVERHRLYVARENGLVENGGSSSSGHLPLSIFTLLPQFMLMGTADAFIEVAKIEFFYDQAPETMKSLGTSYSMTSLGIGNFLSSFLLSTVSHITKRNGDGWILNNLNASHLDYYYALIAVLSAANFFVFLVVSKMYVYKAEVSGSIKVLADELKERKSKSKGINYEDEK